MLVRVRCDDVHKDPTPCPEEKTSAVWNRHLLRQREPEEELVLARRIAGASTGYIFSSMALLLISSASAFWARGTCTSFTFRKAFRRVSASLCSSWSAGALTL